MSNREIRTVRPGVLVSLGTSVRGNRTYYKSQIENPHVEATGEERSKWETTKIVFDPAEQAEADKVRDKACSLIKSVCAKSVHGLLCPEHRIDELFERIEQARQLADDFNSTAALTHVAVNVICGRIVQDDVEAVRAISSEVRDLMQDMQKGLVDMDAKAVRAACAKARSVGQMLSEDAQQRLSFAIDAARTGAKDIVKAGEQASIEIDSALMNTIAMARTSFLDLGEGGVDVGVPVEQGRALDFGADDEADAEPLTDSEYYGSSIETESVEV